MSVIHCLCGFALKQLSLDGADSVVALLVDRVSDQSQRLTRALQRANKRAWDALEIALAGESFWRRFDAAEDKSFRQQVRVFLDAVPLPELTGKDQHRRQCLQDLQGAKRKGLIFGHVVPEDLAQRAGAFARHTDPQALLNAEKKALRELAVELHSAGFKALGWLLSQAAHPGQSVIVVAVRYFFRREVEADEVLARGLQFEAMESLTQAQKTSFAQLEAALLTHGQRVEAALTGLLEVAVQTRDEVAGLRSDLRAENEQLHGQMQVLQGQVQQLLEQLQMTRQPVRAQHSLSIRNDREQQLVRDLLSRYRALPEEQRRGAPDLLNDVGKLQVAVGDFDAAETSFTQAATLSTDTRARAEAYYNASRAALERGDFTGSLADLKRALALDPARFAPFPLEDYEPERILGAGGFGVTYLCRLKLSGGLVAVKALTADELERDVSTVLKEAAALDHLNHPAIIRLRHCGYADAAHTRPYLVMEYFEGETLEALVKQQGALPVDGVLPLAIQVAQALQAAHSKGILHRDIKPANVLVRRSAPLSPGGRGVGGEGSGWEVRLIDFGLALKQNVLEGAATTLRQGKTVVTSSIAGTIDYAAPEQMGRLPGVRVGLPADIYGFARTLCYALFEAADPTPLDWKKVPVALAELLGHCLARKPEDRPANFGMVLDRLQTIGTATPAEDIPLAQPIDEPPLARVAESIPMAQPLRRQPVVPLEPFDDEEDFAPRRGSRRGQPSYSPAPFHHGSINTLQRLIEALLAIFFGIFGLHKFAQGNTGAGWTRIGITCTCIGLYFTALVGFIEGILYLVKSNEEYYQFYRVEKKGWF